MNWLLSLVLIPFAIKLIHQTLGNYLKAVKSYLKLPRKGKYRIMTSPSTGVKTPIKITKFTLMNPLRPGTWNEEKRGVWFKELIQVNGVWLWYPRHWSLSHWGSDEVNRGTLPREVTAEEIDQLQKDGVLKEDVPL